MPIVLNYKKLFVVISEFHGDYDSYSIIGIFDNEETAKLVTKLAYLNELQKNSFISRENYNEQTNEGIFYDEDNDIHLFKYVCHYLNVNLLLN